MVKNPNHQPSFQYKTTFRLYSEFIQKIDYKNKLIEQNLNFLENGFIVGFIFSNKLFIFLKIRGNFFLHQIIKEKKDFIIDFTISHKENKILLVTKSNKIFLFIKKNSFKNNNCYENKFFEYFKSSIFISNAFKNGNIVALNFDLSENFFLIAYLKGIIEIFNSNGKVRLVFHLNYSPKIIYFHAKNLSHGKIYGKNIQDFFFEINLFLKKIKYFGKIENFFFIKKFYFIIKKNSINFFCFCFEKINLKFEFKLGNKNFCLLNENKILWGEDKNFFLFQFFSGKVIKTSIYNDFDYCELKDKNLFYKFGFYFSNQINFLIRFFNDEKTLEILKPLSEKHKFFIKCDFNVNYLGEIFEVKFLGKKNLFAIVSKSNSITIMTRKNFFFKNKFNSKKGFFIAIQVKGSLLIGMNNFSHFFFWDISFLRLYFCFFGFRKISGIFSFLKLTYNKGLLIAAGKNGLIKYWKISFLKNLQLNIEFLSSIDQTKNEINSLSISKNGKFIAIATLNKEVLFWKFGKKFPYLILGKFSRCIWSMDFSPYDYSIIIGSGNGIIFFFDIIKGKCLNKLQGHFSPILCCKFGRDGLHIFSSALDGKIKIWKINNGICVNTITNHTINVWTLDITFDSRHIVSACLNGKIVILKDFGFEFSKIKIKNLKSFLIIQENLDKNNFQNFFIETFKKIIYFYDPILLYDFFYFIFNNLKKNVIERIFRFFPKLNDCSLNFLFNSLLIWHFNGYKGIMIQNILFLVFSSKSLLYLNKINFKTINLLYLLTTKTYEKIKNVKKIGIVNNFKL
jgi:WD40 repeat protein